MRQWHVDPRLLCRQHLLGEHREHHSFVGTIKKKISVRGYIDKGLLEVHTLKNRHQDLVQEMLRRGYNHNSVLPKFNSWQEGRVDRMGNLKELKKRCLECKRRQKEDRNGT